MENDQFLYQTTIDEKALDSLGHVNHAYYLTLFEHSRWDILERKNLRIELMETLKLGPIVLEANVKYRAELRVGDQISIQTKFEPYKRDIIFKAVQSMHKGDTLISEGEYLLSFMDLKARKMTSVPEDIRERLFSNESA